MLIDTIQQTTGRLTKLNRIQEKEAVKAKIKDFTNALELQCNELNERAGWLKEAGNYGFPVLPETIRRCSKISDTLEQTIRSAESGNADWDRGMFKTTRTQLDRLKDEISKQWTAYYQQKTSAVFGFLELLQAVKPEEVQACRSEIRKFKEWDGKRSLNGFLIALQNAASLVDQLDVGNEEVMVFLRKIRTHTATLEDLTEPVEQWIQKNGLRRKIKVSF